MPDDFMITISVPIAQIFMWTWSNVLYIKYYAYLITYLAWLFYLYNNCDITFNQGWVDYKMFVVRYNYSYFKNM
jgi:hypothetical protein